MDKNLIYLSESKKFINLDAIAVIELISDRDGELAQLIGLDRRPWVTGIRGQDLNDLKNCLSIKHINS